MLGCVHVDEQHRAPDQTAELARRLSAEPGQHHRHDGRLLHLAQRHFLQLVEHRPDVPLGQQIGLDPLQQPWQGCRRQRQPDQVPAGHRGDLQQQRDLVSNELHVTLQRVRVQAHQQAAHLGERRVHAALHRGDPLQLFLSGEQGDGVEHAFDSTA